jgi:U3 small nucleolar RNA-associated protein 5
MRVKWYDTINSILRGELVAISHLSERYTCLAVNYVTSSIVETTAIVSSSTSKAVSSTNNKKILMLALGHEEGHVTLYHMAKGTLLRQLKHIHTARVNAFVVTQDGQSAYSASDDQFIVNWDLARGVSLGTWKAHQSGVKALLLSRDGKRLYSGGKTIKIWDMKHQSLIDEYKGHASNIKQLIIDDQERWLFSIAENDRFINIWTLGKEGQYDGGVLLAVLTIENDPLHITVATVYENIVLASVAEDGVVYLWKNLTKTLETFEYPPNHKNHVTNASSSIKKKKFLGAKRYDGLIRYQSSSLEGEVNENKIPIFAIMLQVESKQQLQILLARGRFVNPQFERVSLTMHEEDPKTTEMVLTRSTNDTSIILNTQTTQKKLLNLSAKKTYDEQVTTITESRSQHLVDSIVEYPPKNQDDRNEISQQQQQTMAEKLKELETIMIEGKTSEMHPSTTPKANSLQKMLMQALHSSDNQLVEQCLATHDPIVIQNTIKKLPTLYVLPFLSRVVQKFQMRPNRGPVLVIWIKAVLILHTAYLMSVPNLIKHLTGLYQIIDTRLATFKRLLRLSGRLDLVMSQVTFRSEMAEEGSEALTVYREGEEEDDEAQQLSVSDEDLMTTLMDDTLVEETDSNDNSWVDDSEMSGNDDVSSDESHHLETRRRKSTSDSE